MKEQIYNWISILNNGQYYDKMIKINPMFKRNEEESKFTNLSKRASVAEKKQRGINRTWPWNGAPTTCIQV